MKCQVLICKERNKKIFKMIEAFIDNNLQNQLLKEMTDYHLKANLIKYLTFLKQRFKPSRHLNII